MTPPRSSPGDGVDLSPVTDRPGGTKVPGAVDLGGVCWTPYLRILKIWIRH